MKTIAQIAETLVKEKPFLVESLADGLINLSSLARKIQPEIEATLKKEVQAGAIVMALKRLVPSLQVTQNIKLKKMLSSIGDLILRSNLSDYSFKNSDTLMACQIELMSVIGSDNEIFYTIVQGVHETNIVASSTLQKDINRIFAKERSIIKQENLSSITLKLPLGNVMQPGLYYFILKELAWEGINIVEIVSTSHEFTLLVNDEDIDKAFLVIKKFK
jgi:aspartokinase